MRTEGGGAPGQVSTAGRAESHCELAAESVQQSLPSPPCVRCVLSSVTISRGFSHLEHISLSHVLPTRGSCLRPQMVTELKEQNGLLKTEKDDLNRLIQEQSQQMTGERTTSLKIASVSLSLVLTLTLSLSKSVETNVARLLLPPQRKWLVPSCRRRSSWTRS